MLSLIHGGWLTLTGRYYSRTLPRALGALTRAAYQLVMLPASALSGLDAVLRALWRLHSRRRMLQWVTAADADKAGWAVSSAVCGTPCRWRRCSSSGAAG